MNANFKYINKILKNIKYFLKLCISFRNAATAARKQTLFPYPNPEMAETTNQYLLVFSQLVFSKGQMAEGRCDGLEMMWNPTLAVT